MKISLKPKRGILRRKFGFMIRKRMKKLPPITPESLEPRNAEERGFLEAMTEQYMKETGCSRDEFIPYFLTGGNFIGCKKGIRPVGIHKIRKPLIKNLIKPKYN